MKFMTLIRSCIQRVVQKIDKPVPALPLDLFRIGAGVLGAVYCWHLYREVKTISSNESVIDHQLVREMFPYTALRLIPTKVSDRTLQGLYLGGVGAALGVATGIGIRPNAAYLYALAVSTYRRNFIAMYVDDVIMHLLFFWLMLLPTGNTLTLNQQTRQPWQTATVPGFTVRAFLANLSLLYFVAGLWKWNSPLWREGHALYAALKMPISYAPRFWSPHLLPLFRPASHAAFMLEPFLAMLPLLPTGSRIKLGLAGGLTALHGGIIATLRLPYANTACISVLLLFLRDEIMQVLAPSAQPDAPLPAQTPLPQKAAAATLLTLLTLANIWRIPERHPAVTEGNPRRTPMRHHSNPWHALLWLGGIAQSYRLMDWIDELNWHTYYEGEEMISAETHPFNPDQLFTPTMRNVLLHSYIQDHSWMIPPANYLTTLQKSLLTRYVQQFARHTPNTGDITIYANTGHIISGNLDLHAMHRFKLLQFSVQDGVPTITFMHLRRYAP